MYKAHIRSQLLGAIEQSFVQVGTLGVVKWSVGERVDVDIRTILVGGIPRTRSLEYKKASVVFPDRQAVGEGAGLGQLVVDPCVAEGVDMGFQMETQKVIKEINREAYPIFS